MENLELQINTALLKAQQAIRSTGIKATGRGRYGDYIKLDALLDAVVPALNENGFFFIQGTEPREDSKVYLFTRVKHVSGVTIELNSMPMGFAAMPQDVQKLGAEETYLRKYGITCAFGLYGENDDDGQSLADDAKISQQAVESENEKLTKEQANHIKGLLKDNKELLEKILERAGKKMVSDFEQNRYEGIVKYIEQELKKGAA